MIEAIISIIIHWVIRLCLSWLIRQRVLTSDNSLWISIYSLLKLLKMLMLYDASIGRFPIREVHQCYTS